MCVTQTLTNLQKATGSNVTLKDLFPTLEAFILNNKTINITPDILCTQCNKEVFAILRNQSAIPISKNITTELEARCGAGFVGKCCVRSYGVADQTLFVLDNVFPTTVQQTLNMTNASATNIPREFLMLALRRKY